MKRNKEQEDQQLTLGLKQPFFNKYLLFKRRIADYFNIQIRKNKINDPILWTEFGFLLSALLVAVQKTAFVMTYADQMIPLFVYHNNLSLRLVNKENLSLLPWIAAGIVLIVIYFSLRYVRRFRAEVYIINLVTYMSLIAVIVRLTLLI